MIQWSAYCRLLRLNKPIGILLLWYPTAWALWFANDGFPPLRLFMVFLMGTLIMRSAGCLINDIADRHIDKHVARTQSRPLTSGEVSLTEAFALLFVLLCLALLLLLSLPRACFYWAFAALIITFIYPFCKRFINAPQMVLGLAFSMGIPMAYVASGVALNQSLVLLFLINFVWIIASDTMYAMSDKEDDLKIGVRSTAIYFAQYDRPIIGTLLFMLHVLWLFWALISNVACSFYVLWSLSAFVLIHQQKLIRYRIPQQCFQAFLNSSYYGLLMWLAVVVAKLKI